VGSGGCPGVSIDIGEHVGCARLFAASVEVLRGEGLPEILPVAVDWSEAKDQIAAFGVVDPWAASAGTDHQTHSLRLRVPTMRHHTSPYVSIGEHR
jgi:hypothetical protein